jgi:hypothetical protein
MEVKGNELLLYGMLGCVLTAFFFVVFVLIIK